MRPRTESLWSSISLAARWAPGQSTCRARKARDASALLITPRGGCRSEPGRACGASNMLSRTRPGHYHQLRTTPKGSGISPVPRLSAPTALLLSPFIHSSTSSRGWALRGGSGCCGGVWWSCGGAVDEWRQQHSCGGVVVELHRCSGRALNAVHASRPLRDPGSRGWAAGDSQLIDGHGERLAHLDGPRPDLCVRRSEAETERASERRSSSGHANLQPVQYLEGGGS